MRLSIMSFAGTVRTLVAVGTVRVASMFAASDLAAPLSTATWFSGSGVGSTSDGTGIGAVAGASAGMGCGLACTEVVFATGVEPGVSAAGSAVAGCAVAGSVVAGSAIVGSAIVGVARASPAAGSIPSVRR